MKTLALAVLLVMQNSGTLQDTRAQIEDTYTTRTAVVRYCNQCGKVLSEGLKVVDVEGVLVASDEVVDYCRVCNRIQK